MIPEWFKSTPLMDFNTRHIDLFVSELATTRKPATVNKLLHIVKHAFRKALDWELIDEATFKKIDKVKHLRERQKGSDILIKRKSKGFYHTVIIIFIQSFLPHLIQECGEERYLILNGRTLT